MPDPIVSQGDPGNVRPFTSPSPSDARAAMPPTLPASSLTEPQEAAKWSRFRYRHFTPSGCGVNIAVPAGSASLSVVFARVESNGNYGVHLQPSWDTSWSIDPADKLTTGFTVQFGSAPGSDASLNWSTFRSEDS